MSKQYSLYGAFVSLVKEFIHESNAKTQYEIVDINEFKKTDFVKAVIKLAERHLIERNIIDLIVDNDFTDFLDHKIVKTLTYMVTVEKLSPDFSVVVQHVSSDVDEYILKLKSKHSKESIKKSASEITKDISIIEKISPLEANRIGHLAGVRETVKE